MSQIRTIKQWHTGRGVTKVEMGTSKDVVFYNIKSENIDQLFWTSFVNVLMTETRTTNFIKKWFVHNFTNQHLYSVDKEILMIIF